MRNVGPAITPRPNLARVERLLVRLAMCIAGTVCVDALAYAAMGHTLRGVDYLLLVGGALACVLCATCKRLAPRFALAIVASTAVLIAFECTLTVANLGSGRSSAWYIWRPNFTYVMHAQGLAGVSTRSTFSTNNRGIRGPEFSPDDAYRVLCVGGSTTECLYLDDSRAWPALLGQQLSQTRPNCWVGNIGKSGLNTHDHATLLEHLPEAQEVDCWLVLCGINDLGHHLQGKYAEFKAKSFERTFAYRRPGWGWPLRFPLFRNLFVVEMLERTRLQWKMSVKPVSAVSVQDQNAAWIQTAQETRARAHVVDKLPPLDSALAEYATQLRRIIALAKARGVRLVLVTQPTLWHKGMPPELDALTIGGEQYGGTVLANEARAEAMQRFNARLLEVAQAAGVEAVDLAAQLPKDTTVFYDDCHFNESGATCVAQTLGDWFAEDAQVAMRPLQTRR